MKTLPLFLSAFLIMSSISIFAFEPESIFSSTALKNNNLNDFQYNHPNELYDLNAIKGFEQAYMYEEQNRMANLLIDENNIESWMIDADLMTEFSSENEIENWMLDNNLLDESDHLEIEDWMLDFEIDNN